MAFRGLTGLYAIADAGTLGREGVELRVFAEELRAAGVRVVQWRCKGSRSEVLEGAAVLRGVFAGTGCLLIMNDSAELAVAAAFDGVHVGQGDGDVEEARRVVGVSGVVGVSTHTEAQVRAAEVSSADYVAVGPVFRTGTKPDAEAVVGLAGVRRRAGFDGEAAGCDRGDRTGERGRGAEGGGRCCGGDWCTVSAGDERRGRGAGDGAGCRRLEGGVARCEVISGWWYLLSVLVDSCFPWTEVEGGGAGGVAGIPVVAELEVFGLDAPRQGVVDWLAGEVEDYQIA